MLSTIAVYSELLAFRLQQFDQYLASRVEIGAQFDFWGPKTDAGQQQCSIDSMISPDFRLSLTGFFSLKLLIHFLVLKIKNFRNSVLRNCVLVFDAKQVFLNLQVINLKNNEVPVNPKLQTLEKNWFIENPTPYTLSELTGFSPQIDWIFPSSTSKQYLRA